MAIWAFKAPTEKEKIAFLNESIKNGTSRFGWSYTDRLDLNETNPAIISNLTDDEKKCKKNTFFLLNIVKDDWIVHVNLPYKGMCTACKVTESYSFEKTNNKLGDFRHLIKIDTETLIEFDRNATGVLPIISQRLKLQGKFWRIYYETQFLETITNLTTKADISLENQTIGLHYFKKELEPFLKNITHQIHTTHPNHKLEHLIAEVFRKIPNVIKVIENGKGWGTDYGADVIVTYKTGLAIDFLENEEILVIQVKSFNGAHNDLNCVNQLEVAMEKYQANAGMLITTGEASAQLETAIEELRSKTEKPIVIVAGADVAKFLFTYGTKLIF